METQMESERKRKGKPPSLIDSRTRSRKPLSDCSNILAPGKSSSYVADKRPSNPEITTPASTTRRIKSSTVDANPRTDLNSPALDPRTPLRVSVRAAFEPRSVYTRKQSAEKKKDKDKTVAVAVAVAVAVVVPVSSVFKRLRDDLSGGKVNVVTKPSSKPPVKKNHGASSGKESIEEYVRQQKSYFDEIDAFELLVEEISDEELE